MFEQDYIKFHYDKDTLSVKVFPPKGRIDTPVREAENQPFIIIRSIKIKSLFYV